MGSQTSVNSTQYGQFSLQTLAKEAWFWLPPRRKKWFGLPSYDVISGLYFRAESQNVSMDNPTLQEVRARELGAEEVKE